MLFLLPLGRLCLMKRLRLHPIEYPESLSRGVGGRNGGDQLDRDRANRATYFATRCKNARRVDCTFLLGLHLGRFEICRYSLLSLFAGGLDKAGI